MIIKNIGSKIINIGTEILMPDSQITVSKDVAALPAIQAFAVKKYIKIVDNEKKGDDSGDKAEAEDHKSRPKSPERIKIVKRASKRNRGILCAASCVTFRGVGLRSSIRGTVETLTDLFYRSGLFS